MTLKIYTSVAKGLQLKVKKFWWVILTFVEVLTESFWLTFRYPFFRFALLFILTTIQL